MIPLHVTETVVDGNDGTSILHVPALTIDPASKIGVSGPSGAGKSTFLHLITGLLTPRAGSVVWGNTDITTLSEVQRDAFRRRHFGMIFQDAMLFEELSPLDNAAIEACFAPRSERRDIRRRAQEYLVLLGISTEKRSVDTFSGGERQRVAVARALAADPPVIIADEPTASLDRQNADKLINDMLSVVAEKKKTLIIVSHDVDVLQAMDKVIDVKDGLVPGLQVSPG